MAPGCVAAATQSSRLPKRPRARYEDDVAWSMSVPLRESARPSCLASSRNDARAEGSGRSRSREPPGEASRVQHRPVQCGTWPPACVVRRRRGRPSQSRLRARACCSGPVERPIERPSPGGVRRFARPARRLSAGAAARCPVPSRAYQPPAESRRQPCAVSVPSVFLSTFSFRVCGACGPGHHADRHA